MSRRSLSPSFKMLFRLSLPVLVALIPAGSALAKQPLIAVTDDFEPIAPESFEQEYLKFIIDHHFAALRITELAAGTQTVPPTAEISSADGTPPTPGFAPTPAKAELPEIFSLARRNNRDQREQILTAQRFLRDWYGIDYQPSLTPEGQQMIQRLEEAAPGEAFDEAFLQVFSRGHYLAVAPSLNCMGAYDLEHKDLQRFCRMVVEAQLLDIDEMRTLLAREYNHPEFTPLQSTLE